MPARTLLNCPSAAYRTLANRNYLILPRHSGPYTSAPIHAEPVQYCSAVPLRNLPSQTQPIHDCRTQTRQTLPCTNEPFHDCQTEHHPSGPNRTPPCPYPPILPYHAYTNLTRPKHTLPRLSMTAMTKLAQTIHCTPILPIQPSAWRSALRKVHPDCGISRKTLACRVLRFPTGSFSIVHD